MSKHKENINTARYAERDGRIRNPSSGRYIEGNYGHAGIESERPPGGEDGQYIEGNYGRAGLEPGLYTPMGMHAGEGRGYVTRNAKLSVAASGSKDIHTVGSYTDVEPAVPRHGVAGRKHTAGK